MNIKYGLYKKKNESVFVCLTMRLPTHFIMIWNHLKVTSIIISLIQFLYVFLRFVS